AHKVKSYQHVNGWLGLHMTGERAFDAANASFTGLWDFRERTWSPRWLPYFEIEPAWLPPVRDGRDTLGTLRSAPAAELSVPAGIPVKLGTTDISCTVLAAEMQPGDLLHIVGTTQFLVAFADPPRPKPQRLTCPLGVGESVLHVSCNPVGPGTLDW